MMGTIADGAAGQLNTEILLYIFGRNPTTTPSLGLIGVKGSTEIFGRTTGKTVDGAAGQLNTGALLYIWLQSISNWMNISETFEIFGRGQLCCPLLHTKHIDQRGLASADHYPVIPHTAKNCKIPGARLMRLGCLGCNLSHGQY